MSDAYRKRPIRVTARHWVGGPESANHIIDWVTQGGGSARYDEDFEEGGERLIIDTWEGTSYCWPEVWVIRDASGRFDTMYDEKFDATYEPAREEEK